MTVPDVNVSASVLRAQARQLRDLAEHLEHLAQVEPHDEGSTDTDAPAAVLHGDWRQYEVAARARLESPVGTASEHVDRACLTLALIDAMRGNVRSAHHWATRAELLGGSPTQAVAQLARGLSAFVVGDHSEAYEQLRSVTDPRSRGFQRSAGVAGLGFFVEAARLTNRLHLARTALQGSTPLRAGGGAEGWETLVATALAADDDDFVVAVNAALQDLAGQSALGKARLEFGLGRWLRRNNCRVDSRSHLALAADLFESLGSVPLAEAARRELRASGLRQPLPADPAGFSGQELEIAKLVAQGLSNRQIGERLFLSPRTVGSHLYRMFPKLGITSRTQLALNVRAIPTNVV